MTTTFPFRGVPEEGKKSRVFSYDFWLPDDPNSSVPAYVVISSHSEEVLRLPDSHEERVQYIERIREKEESCLVGRSTRLNEKRGVSFSIRSEELSAVIDPPVLLAGREKEHRDCLEEERLARCARHARGEEEPVYYFDRESATCSFSP